MEKRIEFEFRTSGQIIFGCGSIEKLKTILNGIGTKAFLVTGGFNADGDPALKLIQGAGMKCQLFACVEEPDIENTEKAVEQARSFGTEVIIAIGGGSVLDMGKTIAMLLANGGEVIDYVEVVGKGKPITQPSLPFIAIPTTSGTGSEVTRNSVINIRAHGVKASLRSPFMLPTAAIIDPLLTVHCPANVTAASGMDALTQVIEGYISNKSNAFTDGMCEKAIPYGFNSLLKTYKEPGNIEAREGMSMVSLIGGLVLANAGLGAVHSFAAVLGGSHNVPHGIICACFLPVVFESNYNQIAKSNKKHPTLAKMQWLAEQLPGGRNKTIEGLITYLYDLRSEMEIPGMKKYGVKRDEAWMLTEKVMKTNSFSANPIQLNQDELVTILMKCV